MADETWVLGLHHTRVNSPAKEDLEPYRVDWSQELSDCLRAEQMADGRVWWDRIRRDLSIPESEVQPKQEPPRHVWLA